MNIDLRSKIYINDHYYITTGRLLLTIVITFCQFMGMFCAAGWILEPAMFFLFANAFIGLTPQKLESQTEIIDAD